MYKAIRTHIKYQSRFEEKLKAKCDFFCIFDSVQETINDKLWIK